MSNTQPAPTILFSLVPWKATVYCGALVDLDHSTHALSRPPSPPPLLSFAQTPENQARLQGMAERILSDG